MKNALIMLFISLGFSGCVRHIEPKQITCEQDGKIVLRTSGRLVNFKGSTDIWTVDKRHIVPAQTWTCSSQ